MTADPVRAAADLRELLESLIRVCTVRARNLDRYVMAWPEESKEKAELLADIDRILRVAERTQKILTQMRKEEGPGPCRGSCEGGACETFVAAMLAIEKERGPERSPEQNEAAGADAPAEGDRPCASDCMTLAETVGSDA